MGSNLEDQPADNSQNGKGEARAKLSTTRLVEGVRDFFLLQLKQHHMQKPWPQMNENDQRLWIERVTDRATQLVDDVIEHVNHGDFPKVDAKIDSFTVKNGEVKIVAKGYAENEILATLNSAGEKRVQITVMNDAQFDQGRDKLSPDPDQPGLPGVKESDEDDEPGFVDDDEDSAPEPEVENPEDEQTQGEEVLKPKSDEWRGGFNSRMGGHKRNENPFNVSTQLEAFTDWHAGWDDADFDDKAPKIKGDDKPADPAPADSENKQIEEGKQAFADGTALAENPYKQKAKKEDWERGWLQASNAQRKGPAREPDIDPEDEAPETSVSEAGLDPADEDGIPNQDGEVIETEDQAHAFGMFCRTDGKGTGSNPFEVGTDFYKAWLRGYNDAKKAEAKDF